MISELKAMSDYRESVHRLMQMNSDEFVSNGQPQHAAVLFECFFMYAKHTIKILCEKLDPTVFDRPEVIGAACEALGRGVKFEVLVQNGPQEDSLFAKLLSEQAVTNAEQVYYMPQAASKSLLIKQRAENFAVMDDRAVRYEDDLRKCEAVATMNRPDLARRLSTIFFRLKSSLCHA